MKRCNPRDPSHSDILSRFRLDRDFGLMMRRTTLLAAIGLIVASCSGVTEEEYNAALEESAQLEQQVASLEDQTAGLESTARDLENQLSAAEEQVGVLEDDLGAAEEDLASAVDRYGELADLSAIPNTSAATLIGVLTRGIVRCGVGGAFIGFSEMLADGSAVGFSFLTSWAEPDAMPRSRRLPTPAGRQRSVPR